MKKTLIIATCVALSTLSSIHGHGLSTQHSIAASDGGWVITWSDEGKGGGAVDIVQQRYGAALCANNDQPVQASGCPEYLAVI